MFFIFMLTTAIILFIPHILIFYLCPIKYIKIFSKKNISVLRKWYTCYVLPCVLAIEILTTEFK